MPFFNSDAYACVCVCVRVKLLKKNSFFFSIFIVIVAIAATAAAGTTIAARIITILISYLYFVKRNQTFFLQSFINLTLGFKRVHVFSSGFGRSQS